VDHAGEHGFELVELFSDGGREDRLGQVGVTDQDLKDGFE
jgi:hypothetical protein